MNAEDGVDVRVGAPATNIDIDARTFDVGGETIRARWIVDGTGRAGTLARQLDLRTEVPEQWLRTGAAGASPPCPGRYRGSSPKAPAARSLA